MTYNEEDEYDDGNGMKIAKRPEPKPKPQPKPKPENG